MGTQETSISHVGLLKNWVCVLLRHIYKQSKQGKKIVYLFAVNYEGNFIRKYSVNFWENKYLGESNHSSRSVIGMFLPIMQSSSLNAYLLYLKQSSLNWLIVIMMFWCKFQNVLEQTEIKMPFSNNEIDLPIVREVIWLFSVQVTSRKKLNPNYDILCLSLTVWLSLRTLDYSS